MAADQEKKAIPVTRPDLTIGLLWHSAVSDNLGVGALTVSQIAIVEKVAAEIGVGRALRDPRLARSAPELHRGPQRDALRDVGPRSGQPRRALFRRAGLRSGARHRRGRQFRRHLRARAHPQDAARQIHRPRRAPADDPEPADHGTVHPRLGASGGARLDPAVPRGIHPRHALDDRSCATSVSPERSANPRTWRCACPTTRPPRATAALSGSG